MHIRPEKENLIYFRKTLSMENCYPIIIKNNHSQQITLQRL